MRFPIALLLSLIAVLFASSANAADAVKVFILAGQSNMEGKAQNPLIEHQAFQPETAELFKPFVKDGEFVEREDVFIKFLGRHGKLTKGYGSPGRTGLELAFGTKMGEHFDEPVLLIKTAWGGRSIYKDFRPPSAGMPDEEKLQEELAQRQQRVKQQNEKNNKNDPLPTMEDLKGEYGQWYRAMMEEIEITMANADELFPELEGKKLELAGFVWFQGWNDKFGGKDQEYEANLKHLINDVRKDLKAPTLPVVIGVMGQNGSKPATGSTLTIQEAQLAMNEVPEFAGNVQAIRTDVLVDKAAEELYPEWKDRFEEWKLTGSDHGYHYLGSAIWFTRIGNEMADAMIELMDQ